MGLYGRARFFPSGARQQQQRQSYRVGRSPSPAPGTTSARPEVGPMQVPGLAANHRRRRVATSTRIAARPGSNSSSQRDQPGPADNPESRRKTREAPCLAYEEHTIPTPICTSAGLGAHAYYNTLHGLPPLGNTIDPGPFCSPILRYARSLFNIPQTLDTLDRLSVSIQPVMEV